MANNRELTKIRILDSAAKSFGVLGYALTSTNNIYIEAGVSKGLIFKYFKNKAHLFYAVFNREVDLMLQGIEQELHFNSMAPIDKIVALTLWKIAYANQRPEAAAIILEAIQNPPEEVRSLIENALSKLSIFSIERFFAEVDQSKIRSDITHEDFLRMMQIALLGLQNFYIKNNPSSIFQDDVRKQCIDFMGVVLRGMEKTNG